MTAPETGRHLTQAVTAAARIDFEREKNNYYLDRYEELEKLQLLPIARAVADAFEARAELDDAGLEAAVLNELGAAAGAGRLTEAKDAMRDLGYVWRPEGHAHVGTRHPEPHGLCTQVHLHSNPGGSGYRKVVEPLHSCCRETANARRILRHFPASLSCVFALATLAPFHFVLAHAAINVVAKARRSGWV